MKDDLSNPIVSTFFDVNGIVVVAAKRKDVNGQCTKKDNECKGREIRDSRWNDMKASMYLLGNAFRTDQQKPPDRLRTCGRFEQSYFFIQLFQISLSYHSCTLGMQHKQKLRSRRHEHFLRK